MLNGVLTTTVNHTAAEAFLRGAVPGERHALDNRIPPELLGVLKEAGEASDGTPLFTVYQRERTQTNSNNPNPKKEQ